MRERVHKLLGDWQYLTGKTSEKGDKLKEANRQRMYTAAVKDLEFWLGEVSIPIQSYRIVIVQYFYSNMNLWSQACSLFIISKVFLPKGAFGSDGWVADVHKFG